MSDMPGDGPQGCLGAAFGVHHDYLAIVACSCLVKVSLCIMMWMCGCGRVPFHLFADGEVSPAPPLERLRALVCSAASSGFVSLISFPADWVQQHDLARLLDRLCKTKRESASSKHP